MLGGGYYRGSSTLISGAPGTAKTTLAALFVEAACGRGEQRSASMSAALFPDLLVQKYGGSSVATPEKVAAVAERIAQRRQEHQSIVVAVSAMGKTTDNLIAMAKEVAPNPRGREYDHLLACGEQIAVSMVALALQARGVPAVWEKAEGTR